MARTSEGAAQDNRKMQRSQGKQQIDSGDVEDKTASRMGVYLFSLAVFVIGAAVAALITSPWFSLWTILLSAAFGWILAMGVHIVPQWERACVLRLGKFSRIVGPGLYFTVPFVEYATMHVDQRIMVDSFSAEEALTADLVPVDVDAILFWLVWDARKACLEVENYSKSVIWSAQTAMRDAIGQVDLADLSIRRKQIDHELQEALASKCEEWGITVISVEIRDITVPDKLQDALSREAQARKERDARLVLAEIEKEISEMYVDAAEVYDQRPSALKLRAMNLAYEGARNSNSVLLAPSALADGFDLKVTNDDLSSR